ncbi:TRAP transporter substrate-binding protein [Anaeroselena agilis]|uniref:TRAP transporter substrate-binding protein n=1 Tax=Anaeroselena agilis TaxID=3063788 RepID=A0ABU3P4V0_9FIRM|nr:TRAP transporter substrate-binding protein [Selenomonadales bacterium 4137-cl]
MNKRTIAILVAVLFVLTGIFAGCGGGDKKAADKPAQQQLVLKLGETHPPDYPTTLGDKKFAELVTERSKGRIKVEVYPSSQLGEEKAVIEQVQLGAIAFTRVSSGPMAEFYKPMGVFSLPYIFNNGDHMWKFLNGPDGQKMLDGLQGSKFVGLCYFDPGARSFYSTKPIKSLEDMKGLKIRVIQNKINMDLMQALGASATPMPYGQVFSSLQTGVIDGAENNFPSYLTANHYQVAKYYLVDTHQRVPEVLVMSKVVWDKLSAEDKKLIKQAAVDSVKTQRELWAKFEKEAEAKVKAAGCTVTEVKDLKPWQEAVKPMIQKYRADYGEVLDDIAKAAK